MVYSEKTFNSTSIVEDTVETYNFSLMKEQESPCCIFYIDDLEMDRWLAKHVLETAGVCKQIVTASNGEEGLRAILEYCSANSRLPEVIIVDLQMPRMDGFALISTIKSHSYYSESNTKIILTSAGLHDMDLQKIEELEIENVLLKPIQQSELIKLLS